MTGTDRHGLVLQARDRHLLGELVTMRIIDREQARIVAPFGSVTRANARLLGLVRAGLLRRFFQGTASGGKKALYTLSSSGARLVGASSTGPKRNRDEVVVADFFVAHQSHLNDLYCGFKYGAGYPPELQFRRWLTFASPFDHGVPLVPDGYVECGILPMFLAAFVEVDLGHERHAVWRAKVQHYLDYAASGRFEDRFGAKRFLVLAVADAPGRVESLRTTTAGLTDKIFRFTTFRQINDAGLWSQIWLKPTGTEAVSLVGTP